MIKKTTLQFFLGGFKLWTAWILFTLLGGVIPFALLGIQGIFGSLHQFLGEPTIDSLIIALISGLIDGALSGLLQWVVLRKKLPRSARWIAATCIGTALGWCALLVIPVTEWSVPGDGMAVFLYAMAVSRMAAALFQWWLIRRERGGYWWILLSLAGWACTDLAAVRMGSDSALGPWFYIPMAGLAGSMITAAAVVWLFDRSEQRVIKTVGVGILTALLLLGGWLGVELGFSQQIRSLHGHTGFVRSVAFSPDGSLLASASEEGNVILWDVALGEAVRMINVNRLDPPGSMGGGNDVERVSFSPDGSLLATASDDGYFKLFETASGVKLLENRSMLRWIPCLTFSPDGLLLAVLGGDNPKFNISLWDIPGRKRLRTLALPEKSIVNALAFSGGDQVAWLNSAAGFLGWETEDGVQMLTLSAPWQASPCSGNVSFHPDGKTLVTGGGDANKFNERAVSIWSPENGTPVHTLPGPGVTALALSPDGRILAIGRNYKHSLLLWDVVKWEDIRQLRGGNNISAVAFSPDGKLLATGSLDGVIRFWKVPAKP